MNTETKALQHTPGPWYETTKGRNEYQSAICQESTGNTIALTYTSNDADARLIAAAPDILKALEFVQYAFLRHAMDPREMGASLSANWELIEAAISKAKGEV
jgi:hypothetical protein